MLIMLWSMEESMYSSIHESQNFKAIHIKCHPSTQKIIQVDWSYSYPPLVRVKSNTAGASRNCSEFSVCGGILS
jgi:hypothetical protein